MSRKFGLYILGDEILSGKRQDRHFEQVKAILGARGLALSWVHYLGDDRGRCVQAFSQSFDCGDVVFSCGGIGSTPDDHTRQAAAQAGVLALSEQRGGLSDGNLLWQRLPTLDGLGPSGANAHCSERSADGSKEQEYAELESFIPKTIINAIAIAELVSRRLSS